jgi:hypothetical protein
MKATAMKMGLWNLWLPDALAAELKQKHPTWDWERLTIFNILFFILNVHYQSVDILNSGCLLLEVCTFE